jgi:hypothetical protein
LPFPVQGFAMSKGVKLRTRTLAVRAAMGSA